VGRTIPSKISCHLELRTRRDDAKTQLGIFNQEQVVRPRCCGRRGAEMMDVASPSASRHQNLNLLYQFKSNSLRPRFIGKSEIHSHYSFVFFLASCHFS